MNEEVTIYLPVELGLTPKQELQVIRAMMDALSDKLKEFGLIRNSLSMTIEEIKEIAH